MRLAKPINDLLAVTSLWAALFLFLPLTVFSVNLDDAEVTRAQILLGALALALALVPLLALLSWLPRVGGGVTRSIQVLVVAICLLVVFPVTTGEIGGLEDRVSRVDWGAIVTPVVLLLAGGGPGVLSAETS